MKYLIKKGLWKNVQLLVLLSLFFANAQQGGKLYLSSAGTGRIYDITGSTPGTVLASTTPTALSVPTYFNTGRGSAVSNLAVGYDATLPAQPIVFMHSNNTTGSPLLKDGVSTGNSLPAGIGGIGTNNVLGNNFGQVFGFESKNIYRVYPTVSAAIPISGDAIWNSANTTIFASDTFYDYQNNIYAIVQNQNAAGSVFTRYLYKIKINGTTATATQVIQITGPVGVRNATAGTSTTTNTGNSRGIAYLNGFVFTASGNSTNETLIYRTNISTGVSEYLSTLTGAGFGNANIDLASVDYFQPFEFICGSLVFQGSNTFVEGVASTRTLRVPITKIYAPGNYSINVSGTNITSSIYSEIISTSTAYIDVPITYNGGGASGKRTVTISLEGSTTICTIEADVAKDSDKDGVPDSIDLDNDNDGILDADEMYCNQTIAPNGTFPVANAPATTPAYTNQLLFFDWSGVTLNNTSTTATSTVTHNGITYTAAISNYNGPTSMVGTDILTYIGPSQMIGRYYNVNGTTFKEVFYTPNFTTGTNKFNVTLSATKGGVQYPVNVVIFDPETTNNDPTYTENLIYTTSGSAFTLVEKTGATASVIGGNITGVGTKTITYLNTEKSPQVNAIYQTNGYQVTLNASMFGSATKQGLGFAIRLYCDTDNDGNPNFLDLDSDGDGCPDAGEGGRKFPNTSLVTATGSLGTQVPNKNLGNTVDSNGIPTIVSPTGQTVGDSQNAALNSCICYNDANTTGDALPTKHGITLLQRAGADNGNWPMTRSSAHTVLESNTKGFVITRMNPTEIAALTGQEGMMVYDTTAKCLKIYADGTWKCFSKPSCP